MNIRTIEETYDYRVSGILAQLLEQMEMSMDDFDNQDELDAWVWEHKAMMGQLLYEDMGQWSGNWKDDFS